MMTKSELIELFISLSNDTGFLSNLSTNYTLGYHVEEEWSIGRNVFLIFAYGLLFFIAMFGNALVCHVIFSRKRMRTVTNIFIANLAVSDLLLILLNVPLNIAKDLMNEWHLGNALCHLMNMSLSVSVYASTFTLTVIALDRQRVLLYPLRPRILKSGGMAVVAVIWLVSIILALPYGLYSKTVRVNMYVEQVLRCRSVYPSAKFEQYLTVVTICLQYIFPLTIIAVTYGRIVRRIWERSDLGAVTEHQHACRSKHKKKSIKMLMIVVVVFAICWMPLNLYHMLTDLHPDSETFHYNTTAFFVCHWLAISSTCYNPFIYCWLNEAFRAEIRAVFRCCSQNGMTIHPRDIPGAESLSQSDFMSLQVNVNSRSLLGRRGRTALETLTHEPSPTQSNKFSPKTKAPPPPSSADSAVCKTPDSWKSVSGVIIEECNDLLSPEDKQNNIVPDNVS